MKGNTHPAFVIGPPIVRHLVGLVIGLLLLTVVVSVVLTVLLVEEDELLGEVEVLKS